MAVHLCVVVGVLCFEPHSSPPGNSTCTSLQPLLPELGPFSVGPLAIAAESEGDCESDCKSESERHCTSESESENENENENEDEEQEAGEVSRLPHPAGQTPNEVTAILHKKSIQALRALRDSLNANRFICGPKHSTVGNMYGSRSGVCQRCRNVFRDTRPKSSVLTVCATSESRRAPCKRRVTGLFGILRRATCRHAGMCMWARWCI